MEYQQDKCISKILKQKKLTPIKNFDNFTGTDRFHILLCRNNDNKKFILKYTHLQENYLKDKIEREAIITNAISKAAQKNNFYFFAPKFTEYSVLNLPAWSIHEYIEGSPIGSIFKFNQKLKIDNSYQMIARVLLEIQSIGKNYIGKFYSLNRIETRNKDWYLNKKEENSQFLKKAFDEKFYKKIDSLFYGCYKFPCVLTHEDLSLENIIWNQKEKNIAILDWEHFTLGNPAEDISHIWVYSWKNPKWRHSLLKEFINNSKIDKKCLLSSFRIAAAMRLIYRIRWWGGDPKVKQYNTKISLANHIKDFKSIVLDKFL